MEFDQRGVEISWLSKKLNNASNEKNIQLLEEVISDLQHLESKYENYIKLMREFSNIIEGNNKIIEKYFIDDVDRIKNIFDRARLDLNLQNIQSELISFKKHLSKIKKFHSQGYE